MAAVSINPRRVLRVLLVITAAFALINLAFQVMILSSGSRDPNSLFFGAGYLYLDNESNLPTWFANLLLIASAGLLFLIGRIERGRAWTALGIVFLVLALDEVTSLHERLNPPLRRLAGSENLQIWVFPMLLAVGVLAVFLWRFFWQLPRPTRRRFFLAAALFLGGAVGVEFAGGTLVTADEPWNLAFGLSIVLEETLELCGVSLFLYALLRHIAEGTGPVALAVAGEEA